MLGRATWSSAGENRGLRLVLGSTVSAARRRQKTACWSVSGHVFLGVSPCCHCSPLKGLGSMGLG